MRCTKVQDRLMAYHDGELSEGAGRKLEKHLASCEECTLLLQRLVDSDKAVGSSGVPDVPGDGHEYWDSFTSRVLDRVEEDAATRVPIPEKKERITGWMPLPRLVPAVSIALVVVVSAGVLMRLGRVAPVPTAPVVEKEARQADRNGPGPSGPSVEGSGDREERGVGTDAPGEKKAERIDGDTGDLARAVVPGDGTGYRDGEEREEEPRRAAPQAPGPPAVEESAQVMEPGKAGGLETEMQNASRNELPEKSSPTAQPDTAGTTKAVNRDTLAVSLEDEARDLAAVAKSPTVDETLPVQPEAGTSPQPVEASQPELASVPYPDDRADGDAARGDLQQAELYGQVDGMRPPSPQDEQQPADTLFAAARETAIPSAEALTEPETPARVTESPGTEVQAARDKAAAEVTETYTRRFPYRGPEEQLEHARRLAEVRKYWESEQIIKDLLSQTPPSPIYEEASVLMVDVLSNQNRIVEARKFLEEAQKQFPASELVQEYTLENATPAPGGPATGQ